jgi:F-type H+-transporting ATPase subunit b
MNINVTLISQAIAFAIFIWFTVKFVWPHMLRAIETRQKTIADGLAAAERGQESLRDAARQAERDLGEARTRAGEIVNQAEKNARQIIEEAKSAAKLEAEREKASAKAELEQEINRAREALRGQVAALAVAGAEKILRREIDAKTHSDLLRAVENQL